MNIKLIILENNIYFIKYNIKSIYDLIINMILCNFRIKFNKIISNYGFKLIILIFKLKINFYYFFI